MIVQGDVSEGAHNLILLFAVIVMFTVFAYAIVYSWVKQKQEERNQVDPRLVQVAQNDKSKPPA